MNPEWHRSFFRGLTLDLWRRATPPARTMEEAAFLAEVFADRPKGRLLDLPCGNGRLALALAEKGFRLTALDQSAAFLREGRAQAKARRLAIEWKQGDMRRLPWLARFDGVFCAGNSFAMFDAAGTQAFLLAVAAALKPGGRFVLDTEMAAESVLPHPEERSWTRVQDMLLLAEYRYVTEDSRLDCEFTFILKRRRARRTASYWVFTTGEITRMLAEAGLAVIERFSGYTGEPFSLGAPGLVLVAEKQAQPAIRAGRRRRTTGRTRTR